MMSTTSNSNPTTAHNAEPSVIPKSVRARAYCDYLTSAGYAAEMTPDDCVRIRNQGRLYSPYPVESAWQLKEIGYSANVTRDGHVEYTDNNRHYTLSPHPTRDRELSIYTTVATVKDAERAVAESLVEVATRGLVRVWMGVGRGNEVYVASTTYLRDPLDISGVLEGRLGAVVTAVNRFLAEYYLALYATRLNPTVEAPRIRYP